MKIGDIKIEALKLMFSSYDWDYSAEQMEELEASEQFRDHLINMPGAINRCFAAIENKGVLPCKQHIVQYITKIIDGVSVIILKGGTETDYGIEIKMSEEVTDFLDVDRVSYRGKFGDYHPTFPFMREGDTILLEGIYPGDTYTVMYRPRISRGYSDSTELSELGVPDRIAAFIPYFIKGDLFREEDAAEASNARAWFEAAMDELVGQRASYGGVQTVFGM